MGRFRPCMGRKRHLVQPAIAWKVYDFGTWGRAAVVLKAICPLDGDLAKLLRLQHWLAAASDRQEGGELPGVAFFAPSPRGGAGTKVAINTAFAAHAHARRVGSCRGFELEMNKSGATIYMFDIYSLVSEKISTQDHSVIGGLS